MRICIQKAGPFGISWVVLVVALLVVNLVAGGFTTKYILDYWGTFVKSERVDMPLVPCMLAGLFVGEITIPGALATFILSAFLSNPAY
jgi:hypothetical protein